MEYEGNVDHFFKQLIDTMEFDQFFATQRDKYPRQTLMEVCDYQNVYIFKKELFDIENNVISMMKMPPDFEVLPHYHDFIEILYISKGKIRQKVNGQELTLGKGSVMVMNQNVVHNILPCTGQDQLYFIMIERSCFDLSFMQSIGSDNLIIQYIYYSLFVDTAFNQFLYFEGLDVWAQLVEWMFEDFRLRPKNRIQSMKLLLGAFLTKADSVKDIPGSPNLQKANRKYEITAKVLQYLSHNFKHATLKDAADYLGITNKYLCRVLKDFTGKTFTEHLNEIRIQNAAIMLASNNDAIGNIAAEVGFKNDNYFYCIFKKQMGISPGRYRYTVRGETTF